MVANVDVLEIYYRVVIEQAMQAFDIMRSKINAIQHAVAELKGLRKLEQDLKSVGLGAMKSGRFFDLLTGKIVSTNEALRRFDFLSRKGTFFGKSASDIGNIPDITPKSKAGAGTGAQDLIDSVTKDIKKQGMAGQKTIDGLNNSFNKLTTGVKKSGMAMMGFGLSMLFTGMAIKRFGDMALRSLVNNFMTLADENNSAVKAILSVQAAFGYLKFVIMDTLSRSELFQSFVTWLVKASIAIAQFVEKNPKVAELIGIFLGLSVVLGTIMMIIGQMSLFIVGVEIAFLPLLGTAILIASAIILLSYIWSSEFNTMAKWAFTIGVILLAAAGIALIFSATTLAAWLAVIGGLALLVGAVLIFKDELAIIWDILALKTAQVFLNMSAFILTTLTDMKIKSIELVKSIVLAMNKLPFVNIDTSGLDKALEKAKKHKDNIEDVRDDTWWTLQNKINVATNDLSNSFDNTINDINGKMNFSSSESELLNAGTSLATEQKNAEALNNLSGGSSLKDLENLQKDANERSSNLLIEQKEANIKLEEIKELLDEYGLTPSTNT